MGDTSDYQFLAFYNTMQSSDAAHYLNAMNAMDTNNLVNAQNELESITDTNAVNHNRIIVGNIYLNTWAQDNYEFTKEQSGILTDIANFDPYTNGDAVYLARLMMNINPDNEDAKNKSFQQKPKDVIKANSVHINPNPAKEIVTITFDQAIANDGVIEIRNIMGSIILANTIPKSNSEQKVDVSKLTSGIYFYVIKINDNQLSSGKLIILNK